MYQYFNGYIHYDECSHHATPLVLLHYSNEWISQYKCSHGATRYELFFWQPGVGEERAYPGSTFARRFNAIGVELFLWRHAHNDPFHGGLIKEIAIPMALKRLFHDINFGNARMNKYQITLINFTKWFVLHVILSTLMPRYGRRVDLFHEDYTIEWEEVSLATISHKEPN